MVLTTNGKMKRFAAHYIFIPSHQFQKLYCVELDENNCLQNIFPLEKETANTSFFNGILIFSKQELSAEIFLKTLKDEAQKHSDFSVFELLKKQNLSEIKKNDFVFVYHLDGINLFSLKVFEEKNPNQELLFRRILL